MPPTIGGTGNTAQFYQIPSNNSGIILDSEITVTDPNVDITSATVTISSGYLSGDTLGFNNGTDTEHFGPTAGSPEGSTITATQNGGVLTLTTTSGTDTASDYQNVLESVTYDFTGDPTDAGADKSRTITCSVTDADAVTSATGSTTTLDVFAQPIVTVGVAGTPQETSTSGPVFADFDAVDHRLQRHHDLLRRVGADQKRRRPQRHADDQRHDKRHHQRRRQWNDQLFVHGHDADADRHRHGGRLHHRAR